MFEVTEFSEVAASLSDRMSATLVRPDLLQPLLWPMTILMAGTVALALVGAPKGLTILFGIVLVINVSPVRRPSRGLPSDQSGGAKDGDHHGWAGSPA